jgi:hypothetical protein
VELAPAHPLDAGRAAPVAVAAPRAAPLRPPEHAKGLDVRCDRRGQQPGEVAHRAARRAFVPPRRAAQRIAQTHDGGAHPHDGAAPVDGLAHDGARALHLDAGASELLPVGLDGEAE